MTQAQIKKLYELGNKAIDIATDHKEDFKNDPINWADLGVVEIREIKSYLPTSKGKFEQINHVKVVISEADPDADNLKYFVESYFHENGINCVQVITEW